MTVPLAACSGASNRRRGAFLVPFRSPDASTTALDTAKAPCSCWSGGLLWWWAILGLNQWPLPCQGSALPLS